MKMKYFNSNGGINKVKMHLEKQLLSHVAKYGEIQKCHGVINHGENENITVASDSQWQRRDENGGILGAALSAELCRCSNIAA